MYTTQLHTGPPPPLSAPAHAHLRDDLTLAVAGEGPAYGCGGLRRGTSARHMMSAAAERSRALVGGIPASAQAAVWPPDSPKPEYG